MPDGRVRRSATAELYTPTREVAICGEAPPPLEEWCCLAGGSCTQMPGTDCLAAGGLIVEGPDGCWECACCQMEGPDEIVLDVALSQYGPGEHDPTRGDPPCGECIGWHSADPNGAHVLLYDPGAGTQYVKRVLHPTDSSYTQWSVRMECQIIVIPPGTERRILRVHAGVSFHIEINGGGCDTPPDPRGLQWSASGVTNHLLTGPCTGQTIPISLSVFGSEEHCGLGQGWLAYRHVTGGMTVHT